MKLGYFVIFLFVAPFKAEAISADCAKAITSAVRAGSNEGQALEKLEREISGDIGDRASSARRSEALQNFMIMQSKRAAATIGAFNACDQNSK